MKMPFVDLKKQYHSIKEDIDKAIQDVISNSAFIKGPHVEEFEKNFAEYAGIDHCVGVGNGTDALFIALKSLGLKAGDEVITAANSFIATSEAVTMTGAKVVFVDYDEDTYNIDCNKFENAITNKTKAIIPVHLYGQPARMDKISQIAKDHNLFVIEDAAQAHGARCGNKNIGALSDCISFSFFPGKNLGAYGDAGAILTNNEKLSNRMRMLANHGRIEKYQHDIEGYNSRLDGLQAAILNVKLKHLEKWTERRRYIAKMYDQGLECNVIVPKVLDDVRHVYHLYVIRVKNRDQVISFLSDKGVSTGIHYPTPLPFLKAYAYLGYRPVDFPVASSIKDELLSLPIHGDMTDEQVEYVITNVTKIAEKP